MPKAVEQCQPVQKRIRNFSEVLLGLTKRQAIENAKIFFERRSVESDDPCPLGTDIFGFIERLSKGDIDGAALVIRASDPLPGVTARLVRDPLEKVQAYNKDGQRISIRQLQRFVIDHSQFKDIPKERQSDLNEKIAIIGSGPSGLAAAWQALRLGYQVAVFESNHVIGGKLLFQYPEFRLPQSVVQKELNLLKAQGVQFYCNQCIGHSVSLEQFKQQGFKAIVVATGSSWPSEDECSLSQSSGVLSGREFLMRLNVFQAASYPDADTLPGVAGTVVVLGANELAIDCARACRRIHCEAVIVCPETDEDLPVSPELVRHAREEGVKFEPLSKVIRIETNELDCVSAVVLRVFDYVDRNKINQWELVEVPDSEVRLAADSVLVCTDGVRNPLLNIAESSECVWLTGEAECGPMSLEQNFLSAIKTVRMIDHQLRRIG